MQWEEEWLLNKWCWNNWTAMQKKVKSDPNLTPCTKSNSKWIPDLNVQPKIIKFLEHEIIFMIQE